MTESNIDGSKDPMAAKEDRCCALRMRADDTMTLRMTLTFFGQIDAFFMRS